MSRLRFAIALLFVGGTISPTFAQGTPDTRRTLSRSDIARIENGLVPRIVLENESGQTYNLRARMKQFNVPGVSVAVFNEGRVIWAQGFGTANSTRAVPVSVHTRFQAASLSKSVTAFAVLTLVQAKGLDLDRDVNDYLRSWKMPDSPFSQTEKVTIRRLLSHTAGLNVGGFAGYNRTGTIPDAAGVLEGKGNSPALRVEATPGTKYAYSGGGYVVLQKLIEDQSGMSFAAYLQKHVLKPLHMDDSSFDPNLEKGRSLAHGFDGKPLEGGWHVYPELAPAGLWSTPTDLAKFTFGVVAATSGAKSALLAQPLAQQMLTPSGKPEGGDGYALGFELRGTGNNASFGHGGSNAGFKSELMYFPARKLGLVLMTNSENGRVVRNELARSLAHQFGLAIFPSRTIKPMPIDEGQLRALSGRYSYQDDKIVYFSARQSGTGELILENLTTKAINHLIPTDTDKFIDRYTGLEVVVLHKADSSEISGLRYDGEDTLVRLPI